MKWSYTNGKLNVSSDKFYIGYFLTPVVISGLFSGLVYWLMRNPPNQVRKLRRHFKDQ